MEFSTRSLLVRLDDLERRLESPEQSWIKQDLKDIAIEVCEGVARILDVPRLEKALNADAQLDTDALKRAVDRFRAVPLTDYDMPGVVDFIASDRLDALERLVRDAENAAALSELELNLRLLLGGDSDFEGLLIALNDHDDDVRGPLRKDVRTKLDLLDDRQAVEVLARYENETSESRLTHIELREGILEARDFRVSTANEARDKAADYVVLHRPRLARLMIVDGRFRIPADSLGIARILSWTTSRPLELTRRARQAALALSRVAVAWVTMLLGLRADFAAVLGVSPSGYFVAGRGYKQAQIGIDGKVRPPALVAELRKLVHLADAQTIASPVEQILRAYKAGAEVMASAKEHPLATRQRPAVC
jgi:hypothetical protein